MPTIEYVAKIVGIIAGVFVLVGGGISAVRWALKKAEEILKSIAESRIENIEGKKATIDSFNRLREELFGYRDKTNQTLTNHTHEIGDLKRRVTKLEYKTPTGGIDIDAVKRRANRKNDDDEE